MANNVFEPKGTGDFRFIVMGDSRPPGGKDPARQPEIFHDLIKLSNRQGADFAVNIGDLIAGYTKDTILLKREWDAYEDTIKMFRIPIIGVPGNHDIFSELGLNAWHKRYGATYFSWDHKSCHFIALDTEAKSEKGMIAGAQLRWLKKDLARAKGARGIFVMFHKPMFARTKRIGTKLNDHWFNDIHPLLVKYGVDMVFAGHDHEYTLYPTVDGIQYIVTGGAGAPLRNDVLDGSFYHFLNVDVRGDETSFSVVTPDGVLPYDCVTRWGRDAIRNAIAVEPLTEIGWFNRVKLRATVTNTSDRAGTLVMKHDTKESSWKLKKNSVLIEPGETRELSVSASFKDMLPIPSSLRVEMMADDKRIYHWRIANEVFGNILSPVTNWNVIAPFDLGIEEDVAMAAISNETFFSLSMPRWSGPLPAEENADLSAVYTGKNGEAISWKDVNTGPNGAVRLRKMYPKTNFALSYAVTRIYSPRKRKCLFGFGSDDAIAVRLNGREVWRNEVLRGMKPGSDKVELTLNEGWNELGVKVLQVQGSWGFMVHAVDLENELILSASHAAKEVSPASRR